MEEEHPNLRWWSDDAVAVVTGSNTGIGLEIVRGLAKHGIHTVLAARNADQGQEATKLLHEEGLSNVVFHRLDITSSDSIDEFVRWVKESYKGLDILVNNAGIVFSQTTDAITSAKAVIGTNFHGTKNITEALLPWMGNKARVINVSSSAGRLDLLRVNETWKQELSSDNNLTDELVDRFVEDYMKALTENDNPMVIMNVYSVSKIALNAYTRILSRRLQAAGKEIHVNCMCPGLTSTRLTFYKGHSASTGADTAVWLATAPSHDISTGSFYVRRRSVGFVEIPLSVFEKEIVLLDEWLDYCQKLR